jgi:hypothetical protein
MRQSPPRKPNGLRDTLDRRDWSYPGIATLSQKGIPLRDAPERCRSAGSDGLERRVCGSYAGTSDTFMFVPGVTRLSQERPRTVALLSCLARHAKLAVTHTRIWEHPVTGRQLVSVS